MENRPTRVNRRSGVRKGLTSEDGRRKREETSIQIRKQKRKGKLAKRRNLCSPGLADPKVNNSVNTESDLVADVNKLPELRTAMEGSEEGKQVAAVTAIRKLLSKEEGPPLDEVIEVGILPHLVRFITEGRNKTLVFESTWALTNVASGEKKHTKAVVDAGAVGPLVRALRHVDASVREQAAWCLGNIAGDGHEFRDRVSATPDALNALMANVQQPANISLLRNVTWSISNLCRGKPLAKEEVIGALRPALAHLLAYKDQEVNVDSAWALR